MNFIQGRLPLADVIPCGCEPLLAITSDVNKTI